MPDSRAYPQSPDPVSPAIDSGNNWLRAMFDVGNDNQKLPIMLLIVMITCLIHR